MLEFDPYRLGDFSTDENVLSNVYAQGQTTCVQFQVSIPGSNFLLMGSLGGRR